MSRYTVIVEDMKRNATFLNHSTTLGYKRGVAKRFYKKYGKKLNYLSDEQFVLQLIEAGELKKEVLHE